MFSSPIIVPFSEYHINEILKYSAFWGWPTWYSIMHLRFICVVCLSGFFFNLLYITSFIRIRQLIFPNWVYHCAFPPAVNESSGGSASSRALVRFLSFSSSARYVVVFHDGFHFLFPSWLMMVSLFSFAYFPSVYISLIKGLFRYCGYI